MSFDWSNYLFLAGELVKQGAATPQDEAKLRCATSRAYYAAYCTARNLLREESSNPNAYRGGSAHKLVQEAYANDPQQRAERTDIGDYLKTMHEHRKEADYDDVYPQILMRCRLVMAKANTVITEVGKIKAAAINVPTLSTSHKSNGAQPPT